MSQAPYMQLWEIRSKAWGLTYLKIMGITKCGIKGKWLSSWVAPRLQKEPFFWICKLYTRSIEIYSYYKDAMDGLYGGDTPNYNYWLQCQYTIRNNSPNSRNITVSYLWRFFTKIQYRLCIYVDICQISQSYIYQENDINQNYKTTA